MPELRPVSPIASAIREFRNRTGMTQKVLAQKLALSRRQVVRLECASSISAGRLRRIASLMQSYGAKDLAGLLWEAVRETERTYPRLDSRMNMLEARQELMLQRVDAIAKRLEMVAKRVPEVSDGL